MFQTIARLARNIKRGGTSTGWVQRAPTTSLHMGTVGTVDPFNGIVDFAYNDPSNQVQSGVRFLQAYTPDNLPATGHTVWAVHTGTDLIVLGQHVVPTSVVIPT
jgi:hypothetical protein